MDLSILPPLLAFFFFSVSGLGVRFSSFFLSTFFQKSLASDSLENTKPIIESSPGNEWKNALSAK